MFEELIIGISAGIAATVLNILYFCLHDKKERLRQNQNKIDDYKLKILSQVVAHRGQMPPRPSYGKELESAVNQIYIAYGDSPEVIEAYAKFRKSLELSVLGEAKDKAANDNFISLIKTMCKNCGLNTTVCNSEFTSKPVELGRDRPPINIALASPMNMSVNSNEG